MMAGMRGRVLAWAGGVVVVAAAAALGAYFAVAGLDQAGKVSSVAVMFIGLAGLVVAAYGIVRAHRDVQNPSAAAPEGGQSVDDSTIAGGVTQIRKVKGSVRLGTPPPRSAAPEPGSPASSSAAPRPAPSGASEPASGTPGTGGGQSVTGSQAGGEVRQVDDVGGDVDVDR
jgi:hypothetical protein